MLIFHLPYIIILADSEETFNVSASKEKELILYGSI